MKFVEGVSAITRLGARELTRARSDTVSVTKVNAVGYWLTVSGIKLSSMTVSGEKITIK